MNAWRRIFLGLGYATVLGTWAAYAQETAPPQTKSQIALEINANLPDNSSGYITAALLRATLHSMNASYANPFGAPFVSGPLASTIGHLAAWGNATGSVLGDTGVSIGTAGGVLGLLNTANTYSAAQSVILNTQPTTDWAALTGQNTSMTAYSIYGPITGGYVADTIRGVADVESGFTDVNLSAVSSYVFQNIANAAAPYDLNYGNGVGFYSVAVTAVNNASAWNINTRCIDNTTIGLATLTNRNCIGIEEDFWANGASNFVGISMFLGGPGTPSSAAAIGVNSTSSTAKWTTGFFTADGAVTHAALSVGAAATSGSSVPSQTTYYGYFDSGGTERYMSFIANLDAMIIGSTRYNDGIYLQTGNSNVTIGVTGTDSNINLILQSAGVFGNLVFSSSVVRPQADITTSLGTGSYRFSSVYAADVYTYDASAMIKTGAALTNGAASTTVTLTNAPTGCTAGTIQWLPINNDGTVMHFPVCPQ
jgi:hypothetical protein